MHSSISDDFFGPWREPSKKNKPMIPACISLSLKSSDLVFFAIFFDIFSPSRMSHAPLRARASEWGQRLPPHERWPSAARGCCRLWIAEKLLGDRRILVSSRNRLHIFSESLLWGGQYRGAIHPFLPFHPGSCATLKMKEFWDAIINVQFVQGICRPVLIIVLVNDVGHGKGRIWGNKAGKLLAHLKLRPRVRVWWRKAGQIIIFYFAVHNFFLDLHSAWINTHKVWHLISWSLAALMLVTLLVPSSAGGQSSCSLLVCVPNAMRGSEGHWSAAVDGVAAEARGTGARFASFRAPWPSQEGGGFWVPSPKDRQGPKKYSSNPSKFLPPPVVDMSGLGLNRSLSGRRR